MWFAKAECLNYNCVDRYFTCQGVLMLRFYYVVGISIPIILYYILMANYMYNHADRYDENACYKLVRNLCFTLQRRGRIRTIASGSENLPKEGGYIM